MGHSQGPIQPEYEQRRLERLTSYSILDTPREAQFDRFVFTAAQIFRVPIAVLSLADAKRNWFKANVGLDLQEVDRHISLCQHLDASEGTLVIEDARLDIRVAKSPLVSGPPYVRFYACAPLITPDGLMVGSLSVVDRLPKTLLTKQIWQLDRLAASVVAALEARRPF